MKEKALRYWHNHFARIKAAELEKREFSASMLAAWKTHLRNAGANLIDDAPCDFGDLKAELRAARDGTILCDLSQYGLLLFAGEEARSFLHAQLSSDVKNVHFTNAQYSSYCTAKGRVLANFLLWQSNEGFFAQLHAGLLESIQNRLAKFVLRSKVKISNVSDSPIRLGLAGIQAEALVKKHLGSLPPARLGVSHEKSATLIRLSPNRFEIIVPHQEAPKLWDALRTESKPAGSACWDWLNIRDGVATITATTQELFVPQMANLELLGAVSFNKGCYPGQEIVARTQHRGSLKRRMYLAHLDIEDSPRPGDELFSKDIEGQASGIIVNASAAPEGGYDVLAVVQISSTQSGSIRWRSMDGTVLKLLPLPYTV